MFRNILMATCVLPLAIACGDDDEASTSGVDQDKALSALTTDDVTRICEWYLEEAGGENATADCDGVETSAGTVAECESGFTVPADTCEVTVGDYEACLRELAGDLCNEAADLSACESFLACYP